MVRVENGEETNGRLLAAASEVFAEVGYRQATLREICRRGQANIAAVNYHFHDKEQLYLTVLHRAVEEAGEGLLQVSPDPTEEPEEKLRHFILHFLRNLLGVDRPVLLLRLMAHEMVEPTPALEMAIEKAAQPIKRILGAVVAELLGPMADDALVRDCADSVVAQCVLYDHSQAVFQRLEHMDVHDAATIEHLADHIYRFSLGGIRALACSGPTASGGHAARPRTSSRKVHER